MCAIFGWYGKAPVEKLHDMAGVMRHRGPDGEGFMHSDVAAIGMTRLAIIDLDHGQQPFESNSKSISVVCNGEIYNFESLKRELVGLGHRFYTQCDCEVLPAAYEEWGIGFLDRLNGMFAIAVYDRVRGELILARDRFGQKPLYYANHEGVLYFSSEVRGLHEVGLPKGLNHSALPAYLSLRYVPEPETMFADVRILSAGCLLKIDRAVTDVEVTRWYTLPDGKVEHVDSLSDLHSITRSSVQDALVSDVPVALHLSAGIDSSVLLAELQKSGKPAHAFTAGFGADSDEVREAAELCDQYQVEHTAVRLGSEDLASLPEVVSQMELPVGDALILAFDRLAEATAGVGCKVAIGGEGVDEIFAGYSFHKFMKVSDRLGVFGRMLVGCSLGIAPMFLLDRLSGFPAALGESGRGKIRDYLVQYGGLSDYEKGVNLRTLFSSKEISDLSGLEPFEGDFDAGEDLLESHIRYQFDGWLQDWAIIRQERNTMAHSVEYRMPFLDHRLVEFGFSLDNKYKLSGLSDKYLWRKMAAEYYPETQHKRCKQPFFFPTEEPEYYSEIVKLLDATIGSERFQKNALFDMDYLAGLRERAERTREFLPIKQLLSLVVLDLWMQEHGLSF